MLTNLRKKIDHGVVMMVWLIEKQRIFSKHNPEMDQVSLCSDSLDRDEIACLKAYIIKLRGHKCGRCGLETGLLTLYKRRNEEIKVKERSEDLILLCKDCHSDMQKSHGFVRSSGGPYKAILNDGSVIR